MLFDSVINSRWFLRTSIILFLNKIDVFKSKLPKVRGREVVLVVAGLTAAAGAIGAVLSRVHGGRGHQQGREIHIVEIHASQPCATKRLSAVRDAPSICGVVD